MWWILVRIGTACTGKEKKKEDSQSRHRKETVFELPQRLGTAAGGYGEMTTAFTDPVRTRHEGRRGAFCSIEVRDQI